MTRPEPCDRFDADTEAYYNEPIQYEVDGEVYTSQLTQSDIDDVDEDGYPNCYDDDDDDDGQPSEYDEWMSFDPDC